MKSYAGIGSRSTPKPFINLMKGVAETLCEDYILRTGGADGADMAFIQGANKNMEIYVPCDGFNGFFEANNPHVITKIPTKAYEIAEEFHPTYQKLKPFVKNLMARNCMQILGKELDNPVDFVICYTNDGKASGGTGQALRLAESMNIRIYNIHNKDAFLWFKRLL